MGQFFFSVLWVNVFSGLRKVAKGAKSNAQVLEEDMRSECIDNDAQIIETVCWLLRSAENESFSGSRLFQLLDPAEDGHEAVMHDFRGFLSARKRVTLLRQFDQVLGQRYKEELQSNWTPSDGGQPPRGDELQPEPSVSPTSLLSWTQGGRDAHVATQVASANRMSAFRGAGQHVRSQIRKKKDLDSFTDNLVRSRLENALDQALLDQLHNETVRTLRRTFKERVLEESEHEESADETSQLGPRLTQADKEREEKLNKLIGAGPFVTLAFDLYDGGHVRVRMKSGKLRSLKRMSAFVLFLGLLIFVGVFWLSMGTLELLQSDFDSTGLPSAARLSHAIFFPPTDCDASGPGGGVYLNQIYAVLMLLVWTPATCIGAAVLPLWVISLLLATSLVADDIDDVMQELDPAHVAKYFAKEGAGAASVANWKRKVELPGVILVSTMEQLSSWGVSMGLTIISCVCLSIGLLPTAVATRSYETMAVLAIIATVLPGTIMCEFPSSGWFLRDELTPPPKF